jgi:hypothetical protein
MFTIYCPEHNAQTLIPIDAVLHLQNTADGILLDVECWCGAILTVQTGHGTAATVIASKAAAGVHTHAA